MLAVFGYAGATSTRIGNELGAGQPQAAAIVARTSLYMVTAATVVVAAAIVAARKVLGRLFTDDDAVLQLASVVLIFQAAALIGDAMNGAMSGGSALGP